LGRDSTEAEKLVRAFPGATFNVGVAFEVKEVIQLLSRYKISGMDTSFQSPGYIRKLLNLSVSPAWGIGI
jgi:hypothetical protein